jgi:hypothetical protein
MQADLGGGQNSDVKTHNSTGCCLGLRDPSGVPLMMLHFIRVVIKSVPRYFAIEGHI